VSSCYARRFLLQWQFTLQSETAQRIDIRKAVFHGPAAWLGFKNGVDSLIIFAQQAPSSRPKSILPNTSFQDPVSCALSRKDGKPTLLAHITHLFMRQSAHIWQKKRPQLQSLTTASTYADVYAYTAVVVLKSLKLKGFDICLEVLDVER
jgi:hypothetical protein